MRAERMVTVCAECLCASCWHGIFMCDRAVNADVVEKPVSELRRLGREHPDYFSVQAVRRICGG
jgi:hypothetical protein